MNITIGKFTLETLTSGMYNRPIDLYREYIQNSVDSIDNAVKSGLIAKEKAKVSISISKSLHEITIADNGTGIPVEKATSMLLDIGNSTKRNTGERGFITAVCHRRPMDTDPSAETITVLARFEFPWLILRNTI